MKALKRLDDQTILANVEKLIKCEREATAKLIAHLSEISRRALHLKLGFKSLFEYCQKELKLEESQAWLRIQVARRCQEIPELLDQLISGKSSLTACGRIAPHLTKENARKLLSDTAGMSRSEVEDYLVKLKPKSLKRPGIRKARQQKPLFAQKSAIDTSSDFISEPKPSKKAKVEAATPERFNLSLNIDKATKEKLDRLAEVLGKDKSDLEDVLDFALEAALEKKDPERKKQRAVKRAQCKPATKEDDKGNSQKNNTPQQRSRYIPASTTRQVFARGKFPGRGGSEYFSSYFSRLRYHLFLDDKELFLSP